ncbi:MAG: bifunctional 4-hydroxy-2-oxoglutarate aldolase/2-dehydro-3-deoxy-phosphogluconate aldolase [Candidatus Omnitrophota bacterium]|jgi:2-dehydro-3-deoxyphosphogluconate aldolase/(4S)-4-hydroxy-2-oxoglutarate aldolase
MDQVLKWFDDYKFVAFIRSGSAEDAEEMMKAAMAGGIRLFEISMHSPQALRMIENHSKREGILVGAASVTDGEMTQRVLNAGAKFVSSQYTDRDIISVAKHNDSFVIQGAMTPTEAVNAFQLGADMVKIYPVGAMGGVEYVKDLRMALPFVKLIADAEPTLESAFEYLKHCVAVTLREAIFDRPLVRRDNWLEMTERAKQFTQRLEAHKITK